MPTERVLVEIVTAANMAGIEQAKAGMLGLGVGTMALAVGLGLAIAAGKSMVQISEDMAHSEGDLASAINARNTAAFQTPAPDPAVLKEVTKATTAHEAALLSLTKMELGLANVHKQTALQAYNLAAAHAKVADTAAALAAAQAKLGETTQATFVDTNGLNVEIQNFIKKNAGYISSLSEVTTGYASLVREGVPAKDLTRDMTIAVEISAAENISLSDAVGKLQSAEAGRSVGLKKLVGVTLETVPATATLAEKEAILERNMVKVNAAFAGATAAIPPLTQNSNKLSIIWQELSLKDGPNLTKGITDMENSIIAGLPTWLSWLDTIGRVSDALANWSNQSSKAVHNAIAGTLGSLGGTTSAPSSGRYQAPKAAGGPVQAGEAYTVGEKGPETLVMGGSGGAIVPNGGGGSTTINIHINNPLGGDGPYWDKVANQIAQRLSYASGR